MTKLYAILDVDTSATTDEIHTAYRTLSKKYHPDMQGGDRRMFDEITLAHDVLMDDNSRAYYDRTGQIQSTVAEGSAEAEMYNVVTQCLMAVQQQFDDLESVDLLAVMKQSLSGNLSQVESQQQAFQKNVDRLTKIHKRTTAKKSATILLSLINSQIVAAQSQVDKAAHVVSTIKNAITFLDDYEYSFKKVKKMSSPPPVYNWTAG